LASLFIPTPTFAMWAFAVALPIEIRGGSGGPLRIVARLPG
jgi:kynurenine formamidase